MIDDDVEGVVGIITIRYGNARVGHKSTHSTHSHNAAGCERGWGEGWEERRGRREEDTPRCAERLLSAAELLAGDWLSSSAGAECALIPGYCENKLRAPAHP